MLLLLIKKEENIALIVNRMRTTTKIERKSLVKILFLNYISILFHWL